MSLNFPKKNVALISTRPYERNIALFKELENKNSEEHKEELIIARKKIEALNLSFYDKI